MEDGIWCPHGGLRPAFKKLTHPENVDFQALSATILVTYHADFWGNERFVVHRGEGGPEEGPMPEVGSLCSQVLSERTDYDPPLESHSPTEN